MIIEDRIIMNEKHIMRRKKNELYDSMGEY